MRAASDRRNERAFEVNADGLGAMVRRPLDQAGNFLHGCQQLIQRRGNGGRQVRADTLGRQKSPDSVQRLGRALHHIVPCAAMDVYVDEAGQDSGIAEIECRSF